jgi:3-phenylpropionate/cinnamic acid dioxygenase small subunit
MRTSTTDGVVLPTPDQARLAEQFLHREAWLLDEQRFDEWFELLDPDISYEVGIAVTEDSRPNSSAPRGYRIRDSLAMLRWRIDRLKTGDAHSEDPTSRTVRSVGSVYAHAVDATGIISVSSSLVLYRHRPPDALGTSLHARRADRFRPVEGGRLLLLSRQVSVPDASLGMPNLGTFL